MDRYWRPGPRGDSTNPHCVVLDHRHPNNGYVGACRRRGSGEEAPDPRAPGRAGSSPTRSTHNGPRSRRGGRGRTLPREVRYGLRSDQRYRPPLTGPQKIPRTD